jgi:hypothetical protein
MPEDKDKYNRFRKKSPNYKMEPGKMPTFETDPNIKVRPEKVRAKEYPTILEN